MNLTRRILAVLLWSSLAQPLVALAERLPWVPPQDARQALENSDEFAWRLFVAVNWPADARLQKPDTGAALGALAPTVWETWANTAQVYREDGGDPGPWRDTHALPAIAPEGRFETISLRDMQNVRHIVAGKMVPLVDPAAHAARLTEIHMNRVAYDYVRARDLYNEEGQLRAIAGGGVHFPVGSIEVKAKWRPINADEEARYRTVQVKLGDGTVRLYGLTALHLVSKSLPQWFWATFEHVENPAGPDSEGWQLPSRDRFACGAENAACNRTPSGIGLEGTSWANYRLRGTLTRAVDAANRPLLLANSELEAGMQSTSSCMTCHSRAALGVVAGRPVRIPIFEDDSLPRRGSIGLSRAEWFEGNGTARPQFQQLDFVWSLAKAHSRRGS